MKQTISLPSKEQVAGIVNSIDHKTNGLEAIANSSRKNNTDINVLKSKLDDNEIGLAALKELIGNGASQDALDTIQGILENTTYGLHAMRQYIESLASQDSADNIYKLCASDIYGFRALKNILQSINGDSSSTDTTIQALDSYVRNSSYSLERISGKLQNIYTNTGGYPNAVTGTLKSTTAQGSSILNVTGKGKLKIISCNVFDATHTVSVDSCPELNFFPLSNTNIAVTEFTFENQLKFYIPDNGIAITTKYLLQTA